MRSRDRVLQILPTVNVKVVVDDLYYWPVMDIIQGTVLALSGQHIPNRLLITSIWQALNNRKIITSPHVRELLMDAINYLEGDLT